MTLIRHKQPYVANLFPHQGNRRFIIGTLPFPPNLLRDGHFDTPCNGPFWECQGTVSIASGEATMGPSAGGAERLHQDAPWLRVGLTYVSDLLIVSKTPGPIPLDLRIGGDFDQFIVEDSHVGQHVQLTHTLAAAFPNEWELQLNEDGHTLVMTDVKCTVVP